MFVIVTALLAGVVAHAAYAVLSPSRITDPADASAALAPSTSSAGPSPATPPARSTSPSPSTASGAAESPAPSARATPAAGSARPSRPIAGRPFEVEIPSLRAVLPVVPVGVAKDGQMALPDDPDVAGWYRFGAAPTSARGASVISAHVDSRDEVGPLARLDRLVRGDRIVVEVDGTSVDYVVERVDQYAKTALDVDALFDRTGPARLHLVSCGGDWNPRTRHYEDNVVAIARRASVSEAVAYRGAGGE